MIASEAGVSSAPETPCSARATHEQLDRRRERAEQRRDAEARDAEREDAPLAVEVGQRAGDEDQRAQRQQVGVGDPLLPGEPAAEVVRDRRERDVDDGGVHRHHRRAQDRRHQRAALRIHRPGTLPAVAFGPCSPTCSGTSPRAGTGREDYEARLAGFHAALRADPSPGLGADRHLRAAAPCRGWTAAAATRTGTSSTTSPRSARSTRPPCPAPAAPRTTPRPPAPAAGVAGIMGHVAGPLLPAPPALGGVARQARGHGVRRRGTPRWRTPPDRPPPSGSAR